jgi:hypothetical protein
VSHLYWHRGYYQKQDELKEVAWEGATMRGLKYGQMSAEALTHALACSKGVRDPEARGRLIEFAEGVVKKMKDGGPWRPPIENDDF